jgi:ribosomal protein S18 acetylase RimI-like enzyme
MAGTSNRLVVRRATLADLDELASLYDAYRQFYEKPADLGLARRYLRERLERDESVVFVAQADSQRLVGFTQLYATFCSVAAAPYMVLYDLFVAPGARRGGVAQALMQAAEEYARTAGFSRLELQTARTNHQAQALYERRGWVRDEAFFVYAKRFGGEPPA